MAPKLQAATSAQSSPQSSFSPACAGVSSFSRSIARKQPIIRVVHTLAPKLIKAEPANFRALVQKLTGNHANEEADDSDIISVNRDDNEGVNHERTLGSEQHESEKASRSASSATSCGAASSSSTAAITSTPQTQQPDYEESLCHHDHLLYEAEVGSHGHTEGSNYTELASNRSDYSPSHINPYISTTSWDSNSTTASFEEDNSLFFSELDILMSCLDSATPLIELDPDQLPPLTLTSTSAGFYFLPC